jgi:hypothetical protein
VLAIDPHRHGLKSASDLPIWDAVLKRITNGIRPDRQTHMTAFMFVLSWGALACALIGGWQVGLMWVVAGAVVIVVLRQSWADHEATPLAPAQQATVERIRAASPRTENEWTPLTRKALKAQQRASVPVAALSTTDALADRLRSDLKASGIDPDRKPERLGDHITDTGADMWSIDTDDVPNSSSPTSEFERRVLRRLAESASNCDD